MLLLSGGALLGKIVGFAREIMFARLLGTSLIADSYRGAVTAALLPVSPMQGDILFFVLIPLHREWSHDGLGPRLITPLLVLFGLFSSLIAVVVCLFAGVWVDFVVPGFDPAAHQVTTLMVRVMALGIPASVMTACLSCIEISTGRSRITTARATVQNVATIIGVLALAVTGRPVALAVSFIAGFWILLLAGTYLLWQEGELAFCPLRPHTAIQAGRIFLARVRPLFLPPIVDQFNILIERLAGSYLGIGAIAALDYSRTLTDTTQYLVSQPIGYVVLMQDALHGEDARTRIASIARPLLALALPASLFITVFAPDIVQIIFERGAFDAQAVTLTTGALRGIGCGLWAMTLGYILLRMLSAAARNGMVACCLAAGSVINMAVNLLLTPHLGTFGLGLGETARGITVLCGTSLLMGCGRMITGHILAAIPGLAIFGATCYGIRLMPLPPELTLALAAAALALVTVSGVRPQLMTLLRRRRTRAFSGDA